MSSLPLGNISDITGFSPADFGDAEDLRPMAIQLDPTGTGAPLPYSLLVENVMLRQTTEIKEKTLTPSPLPPHWRRKLKEFLHTKNEELLSFVKKPLQPSHPLYRTEHFLKKFGRPDFQATHPSLQTTFLDASGSTCIAQIESQLKTIGPSNGKQIVDQVRWLLEEYKSAGEDCLTQENALKLKLDVFDKTYQRVVALYELPANEHFDKVGDALEQYIQQLFQEHALEDQYKKTIEAYRRFISLREMIQTFRFIDLAEKEPLCSICLTESVQFALTPCGHTFCGTCVKKQAHACYMCRSVIRDRVKIYFG